MKALRLEKIMSVLKSRGYATVEELARELGVSEVTIRRDLDELRRQGLIERKRGGAILKSIHYEMPFFLKLEKNKEEKLRIAKKAVELIESGWTIFAMGGTTVYYAVQELNNSPVQELTITTNSITTAWAVINLKKEYDLVHTGGTVRRGSFECIGEQVVDVLDHIKFDAVLMGADGIDPIEGVTVSNYSESLIARKTARRSNLVILLADHEKLGVVKSYKALDVSDVDILVTGSEAPSDLMSELSNLGVRVYAV